MAISVLLQQVLYLVWPDTSCWWMVLLLEFFFKRIYVYKIMKIIEEKSFYLKNWTTIRKCFSRWDWSFNTIFELFSVHIFSYRQINLSNQKYLNRNIMILLLRMTFGLSYFWQFQIILITLAIFAVAFATPEPRSQYINPSNIYNTYTPQGRVLPNPSYFGVYPGLLPSNYSSAWHNLKYLR